MISPGERPGVLNALCKMCYRQRSLPKSMIITGSLDIPAIPHAGGGCADVYQSKHNERPVAIKSIRTFIRSNQDLCSSVGAPFACSTNGPVLTPSLIEVLS